MTVPGSPTVRRRRLAAELRGIRESKGKSGDAVATALKWSPSKISRYELARTGLKPREVERLLDYYEITGSRRAFLLSLAEDAAPQGWGGEFTDLISADYQEVIGLGDELVMYEQLQRLAYEADRPNVTLQILPLDAQHTVFGESFVIFRFGPDNDALLQDVVSTEHLKSDFSVEGERETYLHRLAFQILVGASLDPAWSRALILETAEAHWSGGTSHGVAPADGTR